MRNKYKILAAVLAVVGLLLAMLQYRSKSRDSTEAAPPTARKGPSEPRPKPGPLPTITEGRRERRAEEDERKESFYGEDVIKLAHKNARFFAAKRIHEVLENQAYNQERIREGIISDFTRGWTIIYDQPLNLEFWEFAFKQGIPREKVQELRRPTDDFNDWPAWVDQIKATLANGGSLWPYGPEPNRVYNIPGEGFRDRMLDPESPMRKGWEDPELQRLAALVDRMIEDNEWQAWPAEPDWGTLVDKYIISEIPDLIENAIKDQPRKQRERLERLRNPDRAKVIPGP